MKSILAFWLAVLLMFSGGMIVWFAYRHHQANAVGTLQVADETAAAKPRLTEFELLDQTGGRINSHDLRGKVWAGSFFFAACPGTCYQQNMKLQQLHAKYAAAGLQLVSITCDPGNDTPVALAGYAARFNADPKTWKFLTPPDADMAYVRRIGNDFFQVAVAEETHTDRVVLFDRDGKMHGAYSVLKVAQFRELDQLIGELLAQPASENDEASGERASEADGSLSPAVDAS